MRDVDRIIDEKVSARIVTMNVPVRIPITECGDCPDSYGFDPIADVPDEAPKAPSFRDRLRDLLNSESMENASDTPDWILADFLNSCLLAFDDAVNQREKMLTNTPEGEPSVEPYINRFG